MRINDIELSGGLSQASQRGEGATFALLLAMLQQNLLERPHLARDQQLPSSSQPLVAAGPVTPLKADAEHWQNESIHAGYMQQQLTVSARLWHCMHPTPLSVHNDARRLDDEVVANCDYHTRQRLAGKVKSELDVDETGLLDLIEGLQPLRAA